jgi:putative ABC transport system permease protein
MRINSKNDSRIDQPGGEQVEQHGTGPTRLSYTFLDADFNKMYNGEQQEESCLSHSRQFAIFIACLGLFGLVTYAAEQRIKEIGIRKVLGASIGGIVTMISKDFVKLVLIAFVIAFPVGWWMMNKWLEGFAYRTSISWWVFALAGLLTIAIALITVSVQAIKAAIANPVKSLRTE